DLFLDFATRHSHALTEDRQQALGRLQPLRAVAVEVERDDPLFRGPDADEITGEHQRSDRNRTARFDSLAAKALRRAPASGAVPETSSHYSVARSPLVRRPAHFPRPGWQPGFRRKFLMIRWEGNSRACSSNRIWRTTGYRC